MRTTALLCLAATALLAGCATPASMPAGTPLDAVRQRWGAPTLSFPQPEGGQRLLYSTAPFGVNTYRLDFDAQGRLLHAEDVQTEAHFNNDVHPGMTREQVQREIGPPSFTWAVRYHQQTVWSYRFQGQVCRVFNIGLTPQGVVEDASYGHDPNCERHRLFGF
jgi:outer membrane protein assembly factor BamE (lipoprotein component of BamABCDE complex)